MMKAESQVSSNGADGGGGATATVPENNEEKIYEKQTTTGRIVDSVCLERVPSRWKTLFQSLILCKIYVTRKSPLHKE